MKLSGLRVGILSDAVFLHLAEPLESQPQYKHFNEIKISVEERKQRINKAGEHTEMGAKARDGDSGIWRKSHSPL